jgi:hypothetical protein
MKSGDISTIFNMAFHLLYDESLQSGDYRRFVVFLNEVFPINQLSVIAFSPGRQELPLPSRFSMISYETLMGGNYALGDIEIAQSTYSMTQVEGKNSHEPSTHDIRNEDHIQQAGMMIQVIFYVDSSDIHVCTISISQHCKIDKFVLFVEIYIL